MGFYSRYGGFGVPDVRNVSPEPAAIPPRVVVTRGAIPAPPEVAAVFRRDLPTFPIGVTPQKLLFVEPRKIETTVPADFAPAPVRGARPAPAEVGEAARTAVKSDDRAAKDAARAAVAAQVAEVAQANATASLEYARRQQSQARRGELSVEAAKTAVAAQRQADVVNNDFEAATKRATTSFVDALEKQKAADEERIKKAAEDALAESRRAQLYNEAHPPYPDGSSGSSGQDVFPLDALPPTIVEVPLPDGTTAGVTVSEHSPLMAVLAAAGGGFLLGGPIGAVLGAAGVYFLKPKRLASQISYYR